MTDQTNTEYSPARALMVGCGKMGGAMLSRWVDAGTADFTVVEPHGDDIPGVTHVRSMDALADDTFDLIVIAVKPQMIDAVIPPYEKHLDSGGFAVSIAAGVAAERVSKVLGGCRVVRVMPNLPAAVGRGVSALYGEGLDEGQRALATRLVEATGTAVWLEDEDSIDRFTAVAGSGPGYVFEIMRSYALAARELGFDEETARELVLGTVLGSAEMARQDGRPFEELRNDVTSPNGTTQAGLDALRRDSLLEALLHDTLGAAYDRAVELR